MSDGKELDGAKCEDLSKSMTGLRQRKKEALRNALVRCAVELFTKRGYDNVSVDEIVDATMSSKSTFKRYFGSKEDVLFPGAADVTEWLGKHLSEVDPTSNRWDTARDALVEGQIRFFDAFESDIRVACVRLWLTEAGPRRRYLEYLDIWETHLADFFTRGTETGSAEWIRGRLVASAMIGGQRAGLDAAVALGRDVKVLMTEIYTSLDEIYSNEPH